MTLTSREVWNALPCFDPPPTPHPSSSPLSPAQGVNEAAECDGGGGHWGSVPAASWLDKVFSVQTRFCVSQKMSKPRPRLLRPERSTSQSLCGALLPAQLRRCLLCFYFPFFFFLSRAIRSAGAATLWQLHLTGVL